MKLHALLAFFTLGTLAQQTLAAPLTEAKINQIVNDVKVVEPRQGARPAVLQDLIKDDLGVATGIQSRAELLFQDNTLTRLGAETFFSFQPGTRNINLDRGSMLLQVPKDHGGARIRAASVSASITGTTIMIEHLPGNAVKVLVLEGSLRVSMDARPGESMLLRAGKMVVVPPNAQALPKPVDVNLHNLVRTSALINPVLFNAKNSASAAPLPSMGLIEKVITQQSASGVPLVEATATVATPTGGASPSADTTASSSDSTAATTGSTSTTTSSGSNSTSTSTTSTTTSTVPSDTTSTTPSAGPSSTPAGTTTAITTTAATPITTSTPPSNPGTLPTSTTPTTTTTSPTSTSTKSTTPTTTTTTASTPTNTAAAPVITVPAAPLATPILSPPDNTNPSPSVVPVVIVSPAPYIIGAGTVINTNRDASSITTNAVTNNGLVFKNTTQTGSASRFLFGSSSIFDGQMNFDSQFNQEFGNSAVYAFTSLEIQASPTFTSHGGLNSVALISSGDITPSTLSGQSVLNGVQQLFLGTVSGSISINNSVAFGAASNSNLKLLQLYARNGSVDLGAPVTLQKGQLFVSAQNDVIIEPSATIAADTASFTGMGNVTFGGTISANTTQFYAGSALINTGSITSQTFWGSGATAQIGGSITTNQGTLQIGSNLTVANGATINAQQLYLAAGGVLEVDGTVVASNSMTIGASDLEVNGTLNTSSTLSATAQTVNIGGTVSGTNTNATYTVAQNFSESSGATLTGNNLTIKTGGGITLGAVTNSNTIALTAGTDPHQTGAIVFNGPVTSQQVEATGASVTVNNTLASQNATFAAGSNFVLTSNGAITATGTTSITALTLIELDGQVTGNQVTLGNNQTNTISLGGQIQSQSLQVTGGTGIFNGNVTTSAHDINVNLSSGFTENAGASLNSAGKVQVTAASAQIAGSMNGANVSVASSGNLGVNAGADLQGTGAVTLSGLNTTIGGTVSAPTVSVTGTSSVNIAQLSAFISASTVTLNTSGTLALAAAQGGVGGLDMSRLTSLTASGGGLTLESSLLLTAGNSSLTAGSSGIVATGFDLAGFQNITVNNGSYSGESLSANTVQINQSGNLTLTGNLNSTDNVSVAGAVNVGGSLTANHVTAGTSVSAQSLSVGTLNTAILTVGSGGITPYSGGASSITAPTISSPLGILMNGTAGSSTTAPGNGGGLSLTTGSLTAGTLSAANFNGGDADPTRSDAGGNGGTFNLHSSGDVTVNSPISATTGLNSTTGMTGGNGGAVNVTSSGAITVNSNIKVSSTETSANPSDNTSGRASRNGGTVNLTSNKTSGVAIAVNNTGQILALLNAASPGKGGTINFTSAGGAINVNGGRVQADNGTVNIVNNGQSGLVQLTNATVSADVVKVGALGPNGQLIVGGGAINANTSLKLYGGTSNGQVLFNSNVNLNGASTKIIAGKTVTIANGATVTVGGNTAANVYTDNPNYTGSGGNNSTSGTFGGKGATTSVYKNAPAF